MGTVMPCFRPRNPAANRISYEESQRILREIRVKSAARFIIRIYRAYRYIYSIKDIPFIDQSHTLTIENPNVVNKMKEFTPFRFNRVLSKAARELRKPTTLDDGSIYSGYW